MLGLKLDFEMAARSHMSPYSSGLRGKPQGNTRKHSRLLKSTADGSHGKSEQGQSVRPEQASDAVGEIGTAFGAVYTVRDA
jgi:hypothetical protein